MDTPGSRRGISSRFSAATAAAILALGTLAAPVGAVVPIAGGAISATNYPINVSASVDAYDPHVSGDIVAYTADAHIRYYDFFSGNDAQVPAPAGATDLLSDVNAGRIVLTRFAGGSARILVFDTITSVSLEVAPTPDPVLRLGSAIGADTVAFIDQTVDTTGDLVAAFLGGAAVQVTNDGRFTQNPNVAPAGNRIVYESCATDPSDCSVRQAVWSGSSWVVANVTEDGTEPEANPDTDGVIVVYNAVRSGDREIAWTPVGGGAEQVLEVSGTQRNPSVSGGLVSFESVGGDGIADLYLYDIANNRLFQLTSTQGIDESLNDISVLPNGTIRVVWSEGPLGGRDVRGADLELPPVGPSYTFGGFQSPVDPLPTLNSMKAGAAVPVKFSLGGDFGLDIFAAGYPKSALVACDSTAPVDAVEQTMSAGGSGLTFDPLSGVYTYVWKTDRAWAGSCRQLVLSLADGSVGRANFKFK